MGEDDGPASHKVKASRHCLILLHMVFLLSLYVGLLIMHHLLFVLAFLLSVDVCLGESKTWILKEGHSEFSLWNHIQVYDGKTQQLVYNIYDSWNFNKDLYLYPAEDDKVWLAHTDIHSIRLRKELVVMDNRTGKPIGSVEQHLFNALGQKAMLNLAKESVGLSGIGIASFYRSYTWFDASHTQRGSVLKAEFTDTKMFFRIHPADRLDEDQLSLQFQATAEKGIGSKLKSLFLVSHGQWAVQIQEELESDTYLILLVVADKARHDMDEQVRQRDAIIAAILPSTKNEHEDD